MTAQSTLIGNLVKDPARRRREKVGILPVIVERRMVAECVELTNHGACIRVEPK